MMLESFQLTPRVPDGSRSSDQGILGVGGAFYNPFWPQMYYPSTSASQILRLQSNSTVPSNVLLEEGSQVTVLQAK